ncbi:TPA: hypothetical protein U5D40_002488 [Yersinia enterocolitica]|nr:hypothetical protein [Yersinia enterocolitica]
MLSNLERWVSFYDFSIKASHDEGPDIPLVQIIPRVDALFKRGAAVKLYNLNTRALRISGWDHDEENQTLTILMQLCDQRVADPVFAQLENGQLRVEPKLAGEGIAVSAHFIVKTIPNIDSVDHYTALVECVPGITKSVFEPFLNAIFRSAYENEEFISEVNRRTYKLRPNLNVISHGAQTLDESLAGSRLQGIRLISTKKVKEMDKNPYTDVVEKAIKLKVVKQPGRTGRRRLIATLRERGRREGFNKLSISFSKEGRQSSIDLDILEDAATKLFTKTEKVILPDGIGQCEPVIHEDLKERMTVILLT